MGTATSLKKVKTAHIRVGTHIINRVHSIRNIGAILNEQMRMEKKVGQLTEFSPQCPSKVSGTVICWTLNGSTAVSCFILIDIPSFIADLKSSSLFSHENIPLHTFVDQYNSVLEELLNKHAPLKEKVVVERPTQQQWITEEDILAAKRDRRKSEKMYWTTGLKSDREKYRRNCEKDLICKAKAKYYQDKVEQCEGDQKKTIWDSG